MEALGKGLALEPYLASVVLGGGALRLAGSVEQKQRIIPAVVDGSLRLALAQTEKQARYDLNDIAMTARKVEGGYVLDGAKSIVLSGDSAGLPGGQRSHLRCAPRCARHQPVPGAGRCAGPADHLLFDAGWRAGGRDRLFGVRVADADLLGQEGEGLPVLQRLSEHAIAALAAEAVGAMAVLHALTVDYLKTRTQFGTPIGNFQVLQHRAVDLC